MTELFSETSEGGVQLAKKLLEQCNTIDDAGEKTACKQAYYNMKNVVVGGVSNTTDTPLDADFGNVTVTAQKAVQNFAKTKITASSTKNETATYEGLTFSTYDNLIDLDNTGFRSAMFASLSPSTGFCGLCNPANPMNNLDVNNTVGWTICGCDPCCCILSTVIPGVVGGVVLIISVVFGVCCCAHDSKTYPNTPAPYIPVTSQAPKAASPILLVLILLVLVVTTAACACMCCGKKKDDDMYEEGVLEEDAGVETQYEDDGMTTDAA
jgi:hypothetical protein